MLFVGHHIWSSSVQICLTRVYQGCPEKPLEHIFLGYLIPDTFDTKTHVASSPRHLIIARHLISPQPPLTQLEVRQV